MNRLVIVTSFFLIICAAVLGSSCGHSKPEDAAAATATLTSPAPDAAAISGPIKAGLPGGGGGFHWCCFHPNGGGAWQAGEVATNGTVVTGANMADLCAGGFLPVRQQCR